MRAYLLVHTRPCVITSGLHIQSPLTPAADLVTSVFSHLGVAQHTAGTVQDQNSKVSMHPACIAKNECLSDFQIIAIYLLIR